MLAPERGDLLTAKRFTSDVTSRLAGFLIDPGLSLHYRTSDSGQELDFVKATVLAISKFQARQVLLDPRINQDKPEKISDAVEHYLNHRPGDIMRPNLFKPTHLSLSYHVNREAKQVFHRAVTEHGVVPVCFTTSSRSHEQDYNDIDTTPRNFAKKSTAILSEMGYTAVICAAVDAETVKAENPDMFVFATGGLLTPNEETSHKRWATIADTKDFVDVFILGSSVFDAANPLEALIERELAVAA